jgi:uncharacterized protein (DUF924 family)
MQDAILDFWFSRPENAEYGVERDVWFRKNATFDAEIRILLLDQFTRNCFRETPRAFAGDALALSLAEDAVARGDDRRLVNVERWFMYMPFQHAESLAAQERSVALFRALSDDGLASPLPWAEKHAEVIRRFGRFPHRNAILGRPSTPEEIEFLAAPGSRF